MRVLKATFLGGFLCLQGLGDIYWKILMKDYMGGVRRKYTLDDVTKWINYGLKLGVIERSNSKENVDAIMKWIDLLDNNNINVQYDQCRRVGMEYSKGQE